MMGTVGADPPESSSGTAAFFGADLGTDGAEGLKGPSVSLLVVSALLCLIG